MASGFMSAELQRAQFESDLDSYRVTANEELANSLQLRVKSLECQTK